MNVGIAAGSFTACLLMKIKIGGRSKKRSGKDEEGEVGNGWRRVLGGG